MVGCVMFPSTTSISANSKLDKIDNIFETFVPAMRTTLMSQEFVFKLIDLHKSKMNEEKELDNLNPTEHLVKSSMTQESHSVHNTTQTLSKEELFTHFNSLEKSFVK